MFLTHKIWASLNLVQSRQQFSLIYKNEKCSWRTNYPYMHQIQGQISLTILKKMFVVFLCKTIVELLKAYLIY